MPNKSKSIILQCIYMGKQNILHFFAKLFGSVKYLFYICTKKNKQTFNTYNYESNNAIQQKANADHN